MAHTARFDADSLLLVLPAELANLNRWLVWEWRMRDGKRTKMPLQTDGSPADSTDPTTWTDLESALAALPQVRGAAGPGIALGEGLAGLDLDGCRNPDTGEIAPWAQAKLDRLLGTYAEVSPSGTGVKLIARTSRPLAHSGRKAGYAGPGTGLELYDRDRYFTVTGQALPGREGLLADLTEELDALCREVWPPAPARAPQPVAATLTLADQDLLDRALSARNGPEVRALWEGDTTGYGSHSEADLALCSSLAFWTGPGGEEQVDRLFRQSGLYREKWEREDYRTDTLARALNRSEYWTCAHDTDDRVTRVTSNGSVTRPGGSRPGGDTPMTSGDNPVTGWEDPVPLPESGSLPEFPLGALPPPVAAYARSVQTALQVPADLVGVALLGALATVACKRWEAQVLPDWVEPANLYLLLGADVAERKSAVLSEVLGPLRDLELGLVAEGRERNEDRRLKREVRQADLKSAKGQEREELVRELADLADCPLPRLWADSATLESLAVLAGQNQGRMALLSAEGHLLRIAGGHYSEGRVNLGILLPGYSRGEPYREDRLGRDPLIIQDPLLTLCLCAQPAVLRDLIRKREFRELGLVARFLLALPGSRVGYRDLSPPPVDATLRQGWRDLVRDLHKVSPPEDNGEPVPHRVYLTQEARAALDGLRRRVELAVRQGGDLHDLRDWAQRLPGNTARVALLLHVAGDPMPSPGPISGDTMARALEVAEWALAHGRAAFGAGAACDLEDARYLLERLTERESGLVTVRSLHRTCQRRFPGVKPLRAALAELTERGYLRPADTLREPRAYVMHPDCRRLSSARHLAREGLQPHSDVDTPPSVIMSSLSEGIPLDDLLGEDL